MRIGISANPRLFDCDLEKMFSTLKEAGFNSVDVGIDTSDQTLNGMGEEEYYRLYLQTAEKYGFTISQTHGSFLINRPEEEFLGEEYFNTVLTCIRRTKLLNVKYMVLHPYCPQGWEFFLNARPYDYSKLIEHNKEVNLQFFKSIKPYLEEAGVTVCIENLFAYDVLMQRHVLGACGNADETNYYIDQLGEECFAACYDSGHLNHFAGDEAEYIHKLGKRLKVVHFNDSWGKDFYGMDWHLMPGQGDVDWSKVAISLKEIGYEGAMNFELSPRPGVFFMPQLCYIAQVGKAIFSEIK